MRVAETILKERNITYFYKDVRFQTKDDLVDWMSKEIEDGRVIVDKIKSVNLTERNSEKSENTDDDDPDQIFATGHCNGRPVVIGVDLNRKQLFITRRRFRY